MTSNPNPTKNSPPWSSPAKSKITNSKKLLDHHHAVNVCHLAFDSKFFGIGCGGALNNLPSVPSLDYSRVFGANCEIVVGSVPLPVGM
eukprot:8887196-Ditylum_brightwellii.AAC.1